MLSSLVSEWTFDELTSDGKTKDTWGSNHGTVVGAEWVDDCVYGKCYKFNGTSDYIDCGNDSSLDITDAITISCWVKTNDTQGVILIKEDGASWSNNKYSLWIRGSFFGILLNTDTWLLSTVAPSGNWQNILFTFDKNVSNDNYKIYIDGEFKNSITYVNSINSNGKIYLGTWYHDFDYAPFNGSIDDVRIYNSALSSAQIKQNYIAGLDSMLRNGGLSKDEYSQRLQALANTDFAF